jgi:hypothetical protein
LHLSFAIRLSIVAGFSRSLFHSNFFKVSFNVYSSLFTVDIMPSPVKKVRKVSDETILGFSKLSEHGFAPTKGSEHAAGYDLRRYANLAY